MIFYGDKVNLLLLSPMLARDDNPELFWVGMLSEALWTVVQRERLSSKVNFYLSAGIGFCLMGVVLIGAIEALLS